MPFINGQNLCHLGIVLEGISSSQIRFLMDFEREGQGEGERETSMSQNWFGSVDGALVCGLQGPRLDSCQGHVHWLWAHPQ